MAYLAFWWKLAGYSPLVTRSAMCLLSSFALLGLFKLAQRVANNQVAWGTAVCALIYPVFFVESSLAQVDLAAAGFTFWGSYAYASGKKAGTALWFSLAALSKETAILAPAALFTWNLARVWLGSRDPERSVRKKPRNFWLSLAFPVAPLAAWYLFHYLKTGYLLGNPEFFRYNVQATLSPVRIVIAFGLRLWQSFGYMHLGFLTAAMLLALMLPPIVEAGRERSRIDLDVQLDFLAVLIAYLLFMAFVGGAVLARYMLPVVPLVMLVAVSTLWRRVRYWPGVLLSVVVAFVIALFVNPPYGFSIEDNLAYRDYIQLHQDGERFLEARYPMASVLTAWPASDELTRPYLGYVTRPLRVVRIEDFTIEEVMSAAEVSSKYDVALVFSTKYEPRHPLLDEWPAWQRVKARYFGFHRDLPPAAAAQLLGGRIVFTEPRDGQWIAVIEMERVVEAKQNRNPVQARAAAGLRVK
jgi:4-amino-4-deoxy-L-arabinose transferase-like glycosyltransferase